jgi:hypothetical protein
MQWLSKDCSIYIPNELPIPPDLLEVFVSAQIFFCEALPDFFKIVKHGLTPGPNYLVILTL